ncbi:MAG: hypothetical protein AAB683_01000 [Patescibacteria group bacterium]
MKNTYIVKKSERIVSAIYLITDSIKDSDFLKWEIREEAIHFVSNSIIFGSSMLVEKDYAYKSVISSADKIISLMIIAELSLIISSMNSKIVINEIKMFIEYVEKSKTIENEMFGYILSDSYFATDIPKDNSKGQNYDIKAFKPNDNKPSIKKIPNKYRQEININLLKND